MNESPFLILVNNVALLLAVGVLYDAFSLSTTRLSLSKKVITGLCAGLIGIGLMSMPLASVTGVIIDARSILLSVSGLFLGIVPTLIAVLMTIVFRLMEGGQGAFAGILIIITSAGAGLLYRSWRGKNSDVIPWLDLYLFGVAVHLVMLTCLLALPGAAIGLVLRDVALPVLIVYPAATVALGVLLSHQRMRRVAELASQKSQRESDLSRQHLEATLAAIPDLLFEMDIKGKYYTCHATDATDLVAPAGELLGKTVYEVMPFEAAQTVIDAIHEANRKGASHGYQLLLPLQKGDRQFELSVARKTSSQLSNSNARFIVLSRDITDRKKAEQELHIAATAFDSQEGMLITDGEFKILRVNHAFTRVTGYEPDEVIGKTPAVLRSGKHSHDFYQQIKRALETERYWQGEVWNKRKNGEVYPQSLTITAVQAENGEITNFVGAFTDITQRKKNEEDIHKLAFYDPLTGLPNRRSLQERLDSALHSATRTEQLGAVLFIDLDNFKNLNDTQGHDMGDQLLIKVASRLDKCVRNADMVARLGGDEFVVILENLGGDEQSALSTIREIVEKINVSLFHPFHIEEEYYHTSCSIGVTLFSSGDRTDEVMKRSDMAMYQAKSAGKNTYKLFDPDAHQTLFTQAALEVELRKALPLKQLELFYQVQYEKDDIIGAEVLLRWLHPERGMVSPAEFIPLAEETGLILPIGDWVLRKACEQLSYWQKDSETAEMVLAVNVSARQFAQEHFVEDVTQCIQQYGIKASRLKLELTESLVLMDIEDTIAKMRRLKLLGVRFALDDFGTGYSSLLHLKRLPLNQLKIDRSFIRDIMTDPDDAEIVQTIISMGHNLRLNVIAEGVETEEHKSFLLQCGCNFYQGFLLGKPMPIEEFQQEYFSTEIEEVLLDIS